MSLLEQILRLIQKSISTLFSRIVHSSAAPLHSCWCHLGSAISALKRGLGWKKRKKRGKTTFPKKWLKYQVSHSEEILWPSVSSPLCYYWVYKNTELEMCRSQGDKKRENILYYSSDKCLYYWDKNQDTNITLSNSKCLYIYLVNVFDDVMIWRCLWHSSSSSLCNSVRLYVNNHKFYRSIVFFIYFLFFF